MYLYGLAPWIGAGRASQPYDIQPLLSSWMWRAQIINLGLSCWDMETGEMCTDPIQLASMADAMVSQRRILECRGWQIGSCEVAEYHEAIFESSGIEDFPFRADSLDTLILHVYSEQQKYVDILSIGFPEEDWSDPITASVNVIDGLSAQTDPESLMLWTYYRDILDPRIPTPDGPAILYVQNNSPWKVDILKVQEIASTPRVLTNSVWRAEAAYRCIAYTEAVIALDGEQ